MGLTSWPLLAVLLALVVAPVAVLVIRPLRLRPFFAKTWFTIALVCTGQLTAVLAAGAAVNDVFGFYPAWSDLFGANTTLAAGSLGAPRSLESTALAALAKVPPGSGATISEIIVAPKIRMATRTIIYFPAAYASGDPNLLFPVIELFNGYPGSNMNWTHTLSIAAHLDQEIAAGRMPPVIAVMPNITVRPPRDTECVDVPGGPFVESLLTNGIHDAIVAQVRAQGGREGWGTLGYSTGGYCAVNLAVHHPSIYAAAASMSGYFMAAKDQTTGDLYGSDERRLFESPTWYVRHHPSVASLSVLLTMGGREEDAIASALGFADAAPPGMPVTVESLPEGGHSFKVWETLIPACLDWLGSHLAGPLAPPVGGLHFQAPVLRPEPPVLDVVPTPSPTLRATPSPSPTHLPTRRPSPTPTSPRPTPASPTPSPRPTPKHSPSPSPTPSGGPAL